MRRRMFVFSVLLVMILFLGHTTHVQAAEVWDGVTITQPSAMTSIEGVYYYEISTPEELAYISLTGGEWASYNYILTQDIVLNDQTILADSNGELINDPNSLNRWTPIQDFTGIFMGNGHTISGVYVKGDYQAGFFGLLRGHVKDLTIDNAYIRGGNNVGGICGTFDETGKDMTNCYFRGTVVGQSNVGGLIGKNHGTNINGCGNYGNVFATGDYVAGIVGNFFAYGIANCFNEGNIYSTGNYVAGIAGRTDIYSITNCVNRGNITGNANVSGICAYVENAYISYCSNMGHIVGNEYVGGIAGYLTNYPGVDSWTGDIVSCYNTGEVTGGAYTGGISGYLIYSNIAKSFSIGNVTGTAPTGALVGHSESVWGKGTITDSWYLKNATVNTELNALGNAPDSEGIRCESDTSGMCVGSDGSIQASGHVYSESYPCDDTCDNCGFVREVVHEFALSHDASSHYYACVHCGKVDDSSVESHRGGFATCMEAAICEVCNFRYEESGPHMFDYETWAYIGSDGHARACQLCGTLDHVSEHTIVSNDDPAAPDFCVICGYGVDGSVSEEEDDDDDKKPDREEEDEDDDREEPDSDDDSSVSILICVLISAGTLTVGVAIGFAIGFMKGKKKR